MYFKNLTKLQVDLLSIVTVFFICLYHYFPSQFPFGFLAFDLYFVLCGYHIASKQSLLKTYCISRIKEYLIVLVTTVITLLSGLYFILSPAYLKAIIFEGVWTSLIITNIDLTRNGYTYSDTTSTFKLFSHTWFICIEIQFYILTIFLLLPFNVLHSKKKIIGLSLVSMIYQTFYANTIYGYYGLASRLWQFLVGSLAYSASIYNSENSMLTNTNSSSTNKSLFHKRVIKIAAVALLMLTMVVDVKNYLQFIISFLTYCFLAFQPIRSNTQTVKYFSVSLLLISDILLIAFVIHFPITKFGLFMNTNITYIASNAFIIIFSLILVVIAKKISSLYNIYILYMFVSYGFLICFFNSFSWNEQINSFTSNQLNMTIVVKTTSNNHGTRIASIVDTWYRFSPDEIYFITDTYSYELNYTLKGHLIGTNCSAGHTIGGLSCKMDRELMLMLRKNSTWSCHFDDDNYVNIPLLKNILSNYDPNKAYFLGKKSVQRKLTRKTGYEAGKIPFYFATGGAGICFSKGALQKMAPRILDGTFHNISKNTPDDIAIGMFMANIVGVELEEMLNFHSHLEKLSKIPISTLDKMPVLSQSANNLISLPYLFPPHEDPYKFRSLQCYLYLSACM